MDKKCTAVLLKSLPKDLPIYIRDHGLPSMEHCCGKDKLLGEFYGLAISEACGIIDYGVTRTLTEISILMRAYVVLDDFIKDHKPVIRTRDLVQELLVKLQDSIVSMVETLGDDGNTIWNNYLAIYENAYADYLSTSPYIATMNKCSFLFLPFDLTVIRQARRSSSHLKTGVSNYLFSLQLLDDFHDMEEDLNAPRNQNLFIVKVSSEKRRSVIEGKSALASHLLGYIASHLHQLLRKSTRSNTFDAFVEAGLRWLRYTRSQLPIVTMATPFRFPYESFRFDDPIVSSIEGTLAKAPEITTMMICAEAMHTFLSQGVR